MGGLPKGRIIEIYGPESSGKTTLALHTVAEAQKAGRHRRRSSTRSTLWTRCTPEALGVDIDDLYVSQPDNGEQALDICEALVRCGAIDIVVIDSVAALVPKAEIEGDMGDSHVGLQARLMSQALRKLAGVIAKTNAVAIFINQLREKVGVVYGNPEVTTGGKALKFYASVRIDIRKGEPIKDGTRAHRQPRQDQNRQKQGGPALPLLHGGHALRRGHLPGRRTAGSGGGTAISSTSPAPGIPIEGQRIGQGRDNARKYLEENPQVFDELLKIVRDEFMNGEGVPLEIGGNENDTPETEAEGASLAEAVEDDDLDLDGEF